jgi:hypothetical protein
MADNANNDAWTWRDSGNTTDIPALNVDASNNTIVNSGSPNDTYIKAGDDIYINAGTNGVVSIGEGGVYPFTLTSDGMVAAEALVAHGNSGSAIALDVSAGHVHTITLNAATPAVTFTNWPAVGWAEVAVVMTQDGTGGRVPGFAGVKWPAAAIPPVSTAAGAVDIYVFSSDGTNVYGNVAGIGYA